MALNCAFLWLYSSQTAYDKIHVKLLIFLQRDEDEIRPLLDDQDNPYIMEEPKIGVSSQTLVSRGGNEASRLPQYVAALLGMLNFL